jgi:superfamily II DNA or RNA helicase
VAASPFDRYGIIPPPIDDFGAWRLPFALRDYQAEAVEAALAKRYGTIELPTASGKTLAAIAIIIRVQQPTLILVPTKALIDQVWIPALAQAGIRGGVYYGEEKRPGFVTVSTYQSLFANPEKIRGFPLVIFDEGDLATGDVWKRILVEARQHPYALVFTATLPSEKERKAELLASFPVLVSRSPREQIQAGVFVPVQTVKRFVQLTPDARREYDKLDASLRNLRRILRTGNPRQIRRLIASGDENVRKAALAYFKLNAQREGILANVPARAEELLSIARSHPGQRILVFGTRVDPLADACAYLTMSGSPCRVISAETTRQDRMEIFTGWGTSFFVLASVAVLRRGVNVPEVGIAVLMGGGAGVTKLVQEVGRVVRPLAGKQYATVYVVAATGTKEEKLPTVVERIFRSESITEEDKEEVEGDGD